MKRKSIFKLSALLGALFILLFALVPSAGAFVERSGERVVIGEDEVIDDDLYGGATTFIVDGTIKGDLVVGGQTIVINGTVEGDVIAAGQSITINGSVGDDVRIAGAALIIGSEAVIGDDLIAAGYSLEVGNSTTIGGSLGFGGFQALLEGNIDENVLVGANGLEIRGEIGGDVTAELGSEEVTTFANPFLFTPEMPAMPSVPGGLTLASGAAIGGDLEYTGPKELSGSEGVVEGQIDYTQREIDGNVTVRVEDSFGRRLINWFTNNVSRLLTLLVLGGLFAWLAPDLLKKLAGQFTEQPLPTLGLGVITFFGFPIGLLLSISLTVLAAIILAIFFLGDLSGALFWTVFAVLTMLSVIFGLTVSYFSKIIVGYWGGKLILEKFSPENAEKVIWPVLLGAVIMAILLAIPLLGWVINAIVTLFGLGTVWAVLRKQDEGGGTEIIVKASPDSGPESAG